MICQLKIPGIFDEKSDGKTSVKKISSVHDITKGGEQRDGQTI